MIGQTVITRKKLAELPEYSTSVPTGTTIGKRWRRDVDGQWMIGEYVRLPDDSAFLLTHVGIKWSWAVDDEGTYYKGKL